MNHKNRTIEVLLDALNFEKISKLKFLLLTKVHCHRQFENFCGNWQDDVPKKFSEKPLKWYVFRQLLSCFSHGLKKNQVGWEKVRVGSFDFMWGRTDDRWIKWLHLSESTILKAACTVLLFLNMKTNRISTFLRHNFGSWLFIKEKWSVWNRFGIVLVGCKL